MNLVIKQINILGDKIITKKFKEQYGEDLEIKFPDRREFYKYLSESLIEVVKKQENITEKNMLNEVKKFIKKNQNEQSLFHVKNYSFFKGDDCIGSITFCSDYINFPLNIEIYMISLKIKINIRNEYGVHVIM